MLIQSCGDENYSSGCSTDVCIKGEASNQYFGESLSGIEQKVESGPKFLDHFRKLQLENISQQQLNLIVSEVAGTIIELIDKQIHEVFCRELNTVVTQVLSIREEVTILSREQSSFREAFSNEVREQMRNLQSVFDKFKARSSSFVTFPSILKQQSLVYSPREGGRQESSRFMSPKICQSNEKGMFEQLQLKIEELRDNMQKKQKQIKNKFQEMRKKQASINESMRTQIQELSTNVFGEHDIKIAVKQNTHELREDVLFCKKQIQRIKGILTIFEG